MADKAAPGGLFARLAGTHCPACNALVAPYSVIKTGHVRTRRPYWRRVSLVFCPNCGEAIRLGLGPVGQWMMMMIIVLPITLAAAFGITWALGEAGLPVGGDGVFGVLASLPIVAVIILVPMIGLCRLCGVVRV
ncbi:MAG: hypothetical protein AAGF76_05625 [Pseudomonadota bacterium]